MRVLFFTALIILGSFSSLFAQQKVEFTPVTEYNSAFQAVYARHPKIPRGILEAVAHQNTHMRHLSPEEIKPACNGMPPVYGIMGLMPNGKNWFKNNLITVSQLSGMNPDLILSSPENSVEAYARAFEAKLTGLALRINNPTDYVDVILSLSELPDRDLNDGFCLDTYAYGILTFLQTPEYQSAYDFPNYDIDLNSFFGETNYKVLSSTFLEFSENEIKPKGQPLRYNPLARRKSLLKDDTADPMNADYSGAIWDPTTCNFSSRNGTAITHITIHTMQGSYAGSISWFKNCNSKVSCHYNVRASDGQITQMVREIDRAWHVGNSNPYAIGIENEGFVDDPTWYTTAMYQANTAICQDIASRRGLDLKRAFDGPASNGLNPISNCWIIKGHQHFPSQTHTDPGIHWDWKRFYEMLNNTMPVTTYNTASGTFLDPGGNGNYGDRERRRYRISPTGARTVTLNFTAFNVENNYDYLRIYDGQDFRAPLIGSFTGTNLPPVITGTTGHLYFEFESDCATNASGWSANWSSSSLPPACTTPSGLAQTFVGHSAANLSWGAVSGAVNYEIRYRRSFTNTWTVRTSNTNSFILTGLAANGHYYWQVRTNCGNNLYSSYAGASFVTPNRTNATINSCTGTFTDAGGSEGKYANNENWVTTIAPTGASSVTMNFTSFATANSSDYLRIYNGPNVNAPLIGTYHTNTSPGTVTGTTGSLTFQFVSNASTVANGWVASWTCQNGGGCGTPTGPATSAIGQNTATFSWASVMNATSYEVRYRRTVDVTWTTANTTQISYIATGLTANTAYEWQVRAVCSGIFSLWTTSSNFITLPVCNATSGLNASGITFNSATLGWNAVVGAVNYTLAYKPNSGGTWTEVTVSGTSYVVTGLSANTLYDYRVQTNCSGSQSAFTPVSNFMTLPLPCNVPSGLNTTAITNNSATLNWASVANALDYTVRYRNIGNPNWTTQTTANLFYNLTGLLSSTIYEWQVQANCSGNNSGFTLSTNFTTTAPPACPVPTGTVTSNITHNSATLSWDAMSGAVNYRVIYRLSSDVNWTGFDVNGTTTTLTGLLPNEEYRWGVRSNCGVSSSAYSSAVLFTTLPVCNVPSGLNSTNITTNTATVSWNFVSGAVNYTLQWRMLGFPSWSATTVSGTSHILSGLSANTGYEWQVRTNCSGNESGFSGLQNFTTLPVCNVPSGLNSTEVSTTVATLNWLPVSGALDYTLQYKLNASPTWTSMVLTETTRTLTGLSASTIYDWRVRANCGNGNISAYSTVQNFTTTASCTDINEPNNSSTAATPLTIGVSKLGRICGQGDVDWYKFTISATTNVRFTLSQLPHNYNLELYINGTFAAGSYQTGTTNDVIIRNGQTANTLFYRVYGQSNVFDNLLDYRVLAETSNVAYRDEDAVILDEKEIARIYPNPATDVVNLTFQHQITGSAQVQIIDMNGRMIYQSIVVDPINGFTIPTSEWSNGIYLLRIFNENRFQTEKLIIQR